MVFGMVGVAIAAPIPNGNSLMNSYGKGFDPIKQGRKNRSNDSSGQGCWNRPSQATDGYSIALNEPYATDCSSMVGVETTWMYAPGCTDFGFARNRMPSGHCSVDDQLATNFGNLVVRSSDQILGRVDVLPQILGTQKPLSPTVSFDTQQANSWNILSSSILINHALLGQTLRFDRRGNGLFDWDEAEEASPALDFDHQLMMSGKLAHLVPKTGNGPRGLEWGDLVFLFLFAFMPEKKQIKNLFRGIRQFKMF
jgi:hypothetical protein